MRSIGRFYDVLTRLGVHLDFFTSSAFPTNHNTNYISLLSMIYKTSDSSLFYGGPVGLLALRSALDH